MCEQGHERTFRSDCYSARHRIGKGVFRCVVKTRIWIAVSVYALVTIVRKRLGLLASLDQILQILSVTLCEKHHMLPNGCSSWPNDAQKKAGQI